MRSTDEPTDTFGKLPPKSPEPQKPATDTWTNTDTPHIQRNQEGKLRTNLPDRGPAL